MNRRLLLAVTVIAAALLVTALLTIVLCALEIPAHAYGPDGNLRRWCRTTADQLDHAPAIRQAFPDAPVMVRVSCCESMGDPAAVNRRSGDWGLGQIHWSSWRRALTDAGIANTPQQLLDPTIGIAAMRYVYDTQGLRAWRPSRRCWA